jgi:perosamine synthetase
VGVPVYSCASLRNAVGLVGATPVYLDSSTDHPNVAMPQTALDILIAPSIFGEPVAVAPARPYRLIEDLAQAFGAQVGGEKIGLRGEVGVCSFYATKLFTSGGQGGAVISRDRALIDAIRDYRQFDCRDDAKLRFNFQMTDLQAAVGRVQLSRLPEFLEKRAERVALYRRQGLPLLGGAGAHSQPAHYRAVLACRTPDALIAALAADSIRAIVPVTESELLDDPHRHPQARRFARGLVSLPLYPDLSLAEAQRVATTACRALENAPLSS